MMQEESEDKSVSIAARSISIDTVAHEFLSMPNLDASVEQRAYLVESTLPTVILALEKLLIEVSRGVDDPARVEDARKSFHLQPDNIPLTFDPINWLGQYLYRNNPSYANYSDASPYISNMQEVAQRLKERLRQLQGERIARLKAQKDLHEQEKERRRAVKLQQKSEKQKAIQLLSTALLHKLVAATWSPEGYLNKHTLLDVLKQTMERPSIQDRVPICEDIRQLRDYIDTTFHMGKDIAIADPLFIDRFTGMTMRWSNRDFNEFVRMFSSAVSDMTAQPQQEFDAAFAPLEACSTGFASDTLLVSQIDAIIDGFPVNDESALPMKRALQRWAQDRLAARGGLFQTDAEANATATSAQQGLTKLLQQLAGQHSVASVKVLMDFLERRLTDAAQTLAEQAAKDAEKAKSGDGDGMSKLQNGSQEGGNSLQESGDGEVSVDRGRQLRTLFKQLVGTKQTPRPTEIATRFINKAISMAALSCSETIAPRVGQLTIPVPLLTIQTHLTSGDAFVEHIKTALAEASDTEFEEVVSAVREVVLARHNEIFGLFPDRQQAEDRAVREVIQQTREAELSFQKLCSATIASLTDLLKTYHPNVNARVFLLEPNALDAVEEQAEDPLDSKDSLAQRSQHAVLVARTDAPDVGKTVSTGIVMQVADSGEAMVLPVATEQSDVLVSPDELHLAHADKLGAAVAIPLKNKEGETIGVLQVDIMAPYDSSVQIESAPANVDLFEEQDVAFMQTVAQQLSDGLDLLESRSKTVIIAESSAVFLAEQADAYTSFFIVEQPSVTRKKLQDTSILRAEPVDSIESEGLSRFLRTSQHRLIEIDPEDKEGAALFQAALSKSMASFEEDGVVKTIVPIVDAEGKVVAIMVVAPNNAAVTQIEKQDLDEVVKVAQVLGTALNSVRKQGLRKAKRRKREFGMCFSPPMHSADDLDEDGALVFAKYMLSTIRDSISELDSSAIAELKSYKKPPPTIHKVLKCILYLFGKTPKQVRLWSDTVKFLNMDLLRQMVAYDPTSPQKKSRFIRIRKVLKTIPHGDVKKKGSLPAQTVYAWLIITLDLRDKAVDARKRANLTSSLPEPPEEAAGPDDEDLDETEVEES
ncbi:hypothetical protein RI367_002142 [Sorochytrium milnesiophthora]